MYDQHPTSQHTVIQHGHHATIRPWHDPQLDERGIDPRDRYCERFWLGVIGPTALWVMRRFADEFDRSPEGFTIDLAHTAATMGMSYARGSNSPFGKAVHRCVMFGIALPAEGGFTVRRRLPTVARRHLERLPADVRDSHEEWARRAVRSDRREIERHLVAAGVPADAAARAGEFVALTS